MKSKFKFLILISACALAVVFAFYGQSWAPHPYCGDGNADPGEECGEPGLPDCADGYTCVDCMCMPIQGEEGCTPGFWKQEQHFACWVTYIPEDSFNEVFDTDITILWSEKGKPGIVEEPTLLQALQANGGGDNRLARHGTAALLNAINGDVYYPLSVEKVIEAVQDGNADKLEDANILGCPLGQCNDIIPSFGDMSVLPSSDDISACGTTASMHGNTRALNLTFIGIVFGAVFLWRKLRI